MSQSNADWWSATANRGIVGLGPEPWSDLDDVFSWPTDGYDDGMFVCASNAQTPLSRSGHTREEWIALADEMVRRWTAFRSHIEGISGPSEGRGR